MKLCGCKLVAMTNGPEESVLASDSHVREMVGCIIYNYSRPVIWYMYGGIGVQVVRVAPPPVGEVMDTTGAGDAFLGGLLVGKFRDY